MSRTIRKSRRGKIYRDGRSQWENFPYSAPKEWRHTYMTLPRRHENKRMCKVIMDCGTEQPDYSHDLTWLSHNYEDAIWPLGNYKPHEYYW